MSPEYIKMLEKATEIKEQWKPVIGDFYIVHKGYVQNVHSAEDRSLFVAMGAIWLPRQDQLQEMSKYEFPLYLVEFYHFCLENGQFESMEQLWSAFVMKENYNKVWNGEDWTELGDG